MASGGGTRVPVDVEIARQDALRACNPDIERPFASLEDACERLLPFHVLADYDADDVSDKFLDSTGRVLSRSQLWNESLTAKINEFKSTLQKQIDTFNAINRKWADGEMRAEERLMIEQFLMQDEKQKLLEMKRELEARERTDREAEARKKEAIAQAQAHAFAEAQAQAQAQAQAEVHTRAEAARMNMVQAEAARMQVQAEVARMQAHAEALRQAHAGAILLQGHHPDTGGRLQPPPGALRTKADEYHFGSQKHGEENAGLESASQEEDRTVQDMLDSWEPLEEDASESNADDLFNGDNVADMDLLTTNTMQGEVRTLDLNSLTSR